jgi:murein L,D-transpeptidase YcbB/YkuD
MRVIIGNRKNHTPLFDSNVTHVIFNPQWHVPEKIAKNELIPKLLKDPNYFINAGFVVTKDGEVVDPLHMTADEGGDFSFRQLAGDDNALGKVKFDLPDTDNIYLHSTPSPRLFAKDDRALSHGCIRVQSPRELTHFVLRNEAKWDANRIDKTYDNDKEHSVKVDESIPVHLVYWTAFVDASGIVHFYNDVYAKDPAEMGKSAAAKTLTLAAK